MLKRPGLSTTYSTTTGEGRASIYFNGSVYVAVGSGVYKCPSTTPIITLTGSTGAVGMKLGDSVEFGQYLFICDGTKAWVVETDNTITEITDTGVNSVVVDAGGSGYTTATVSFTGTGTGAAATATIIGGVVVSIDVTSVGSGYTVAPTVTITGDGSNATASAFLTGFPNPHVISPSFMDGYMFLVKGTDIYNCNLDDPTRWSADEFITAEMYPDPIIGLARQNNQLIALGQYSTEYFFDAGNAVGSPLNKNDAITFQLGLASPQAISEDEKTVIWIAQSRLGGRSVWMIDGFQAKQIGADPIERLLDLEADAAAITGYVVRTKGHFLYIINLPTANRTFVYDMDEKVWQEWSSFDGTNHNMFAYHSVCDDNTGKPLLLHKTNGTVCRLDPNVYKDPDQAIRYQMNSPRFDDNTYNRKHLRQLALVGDITSGTTQPVSIRWSDNDQQLYSATRILDLNREKPTLTQCGSFRRRSFEIVHDADADIRLESIELTYVIGGH
jgi:hypothetical protein